MLILRKLKAEKAKRSGAQAKGGNEKMHLDGDYISLWIFLVFAFILFGVLIIFSPRIMNYLDYLADAKFRAQKPSSPKIDVGKLKEDE